MYFLFLFCFCFFKNQPLVWKNMWNFSNSESHSTNLKMRSVNQGTIFLNFFFSFPSSDFSEAVKDDQYSKEKALKTCHISPQHSLFTVALCLQPLAKTLNKHKLLLSIISEWALLSVTVGGLFTKLLETHSPSGLKLKKTYKHTQNWITSGSNPQCGNQSWTE